MSASASPIPSFDLGTGPTAALKNSIDPAILTAACTGMLPGQPMAPDCTNGFPVQIMLVVTNDTDSVTTVDTVKLRFTPTVTLATPIYGLASPNAIPTISRLSATLNGVVTPIADPPVTSLPRDTSTAIHAAVDQTMAVESYPGADANGNPATLTEHLFMTWFVESGETDNARTSYLDDTTPFDTFQMNTWTPALTKDYPSSTARLFVVIHDNRGGVSWQTGVVNLDSTP
jgi:hypothetical protein